MYLVIRYFLIEKYLKNQFIYLERKNKVKIIQFINGRKTPRAFIHEGLYYFYFVFIFIFIFYSKSNSTSLHFDFTTKPLSIIQSFISSDKPSSSSNSSPLRIP